MFVSYSASTLCPTEALVTYSGALEATESGHSGPSACPLKALHVLTLGGGHGASSSLPIYPNSVVPCSLLKTSSFRFLEHSKLPQKSCFVVSGQFEMGPSVYLPQLTPRTAFIDSVFLGAVGCPRPCSCLLTVFLAVDICLFFLPFLLKCGENVVITCIVQRIPT